MALKSILIAVVVLTLSGFATSINAQASDFQIHFKMREKDLLVDGCKLDIISRDLDKVIGRFELRSGRVSLPDAGLNDGAYDVTIFCKEFKVFLDSVDKSLFQNKWLIEIWRTSRVRRGAAAYIRASEYRVTFYPRNAEAVKTYYKL